MRPQMQKASVLENMHWNVKCIGTDFIAQEKIRVRESKSASEKKLANYLNEPIFTYSSDHSN